MSQTEQLVRRLPNDIGGVPAEPIQRVDHELEPWEKRCHALADVLDFHKIINTEEKRRGVRPAHEHRHRAPHECIVPSLRGTATPGAHALGHGLYGRRRVRRSRGPGAGVARATGVVTSLCPRKVTQNSTRRPRMDDPTRWTSAHRSSSPR